MDKLYKPPTPYKRILVTANFLLNHEKSVVRMFHDNQIMSLANFRLIANVECGTRLKGHPSTGDNHNITDNSPSPDCPSIHFNT